MSYQTLAEQLVEAGKVLYEWGMVPATSGNFSARIDDDSIAITVSGQHKGKMTPDDIMRISLAGEPLDGKKSSAETALHTQLYQRLPDIRAVLHVHSKSSTLISRQLKQELVLQGFELLKALPGIDTHAVKVIVPVFENDQNIPQLASVVDSYMQQNTSVPAYLIRGHGLYVWGNSIKDVLNYIEALDFLFQCELSERGVQLS